MFWGLGSASQLLIPKIRFPIFFLLSLVLVDPCLGVEYMTLLHASFLPPN